MALRENKLHSIIVGSCPQCRQQNMYKDKNPYVISKLYKMHEKCSSCGLKYKMEPSFFFGAMYVSYALGVAIAIAVFMITKLLFDVTLLHTFTIISISLLVLLPIIGRISRNIWIHLFVKYDPEKKENY